MMEFPEPQALLSTPETVAGPQTAMEKQLLADLVLARDALEKMKQVLSSRIRYDSSSSNSKKLEKEVEELQRENATLRRVLASARNREAQAERFASRLEGCFYSYGMMLFLNSGETATLVSLGADASLAKAAAAAVLAQPQLKLSVVPPLSGEMPSIEQSEIVKVSVFFDFSR
jgi:hypothetical protein